MKHRARTPAVTLCALLLLAGAGCSGVRSTEPSAETASATADTSEAQQELVAKGKTQFLHCNTCHLVDADAPEPFGGMQGPHLENIVGRPVASVAGFGYTEELQGLDVVWDEETLDRWLEDPQVISPLICEPFTGMANADYRKALIAYLKNPPAR